jgi:hypothetical protein
VIIEKLNERYENDEINKKDSILKLKEKIKRLKNEKILFEEECNEMKNKLDYSMKLLEKFNKLNKNNKEINYTRNDHE